MTMRVSGLWRYPVKSMGGEELDHVDLDRRGPRGDRLWAVRDVERATTASARRLPALLGCRARYVTSPDGDAGPGAAPPVVITLPDGTEIGSDDPRVHDALSAALGRELRLVPLPADRGSFRLPWRERLTAFTPRRLAGDMGVDDGDALPRYGGLTTRSLLTVARYATPPGSYVDLSPVHVLTESSLATVGAALDGPAADPRRFRPNVLLSGAADGLPEQAWTGGVLTVGAVRLHVTMPTVRCVVPSRQQADVPLERRMGRTLAAVGERYLGCYADVRSGGTIALGDDVGFEAPQDPSRVVRSARTARRAAIDSVSRLADLARR